MSTTTLDPVRVPEKARSELPSTDPPRGPCHVMGNDHRALCGSRSAWGNTEVRARCSYCGLPKCPQCLDRVFGVGPQ